MKNNSKEITIYDIAKMLKVSTTTVSRSLSDHSSIGKKTKEAVRTLAKELDYQPNANASNLRKKKTLTIGVIVSHINRPFISSAISGIEEVMNKAGYNVIISQSNDSYAKEVANCKTLYSSRVDGLIVSLAMETENYDHFLPFQRKGIPLVFFDRIGQELEVDKIIIDDFMAGFKATEHLILNGCRRIAHFAGSQNRHIYKSRLEGYKKALQKHSIPIDERIILYSKLSHEDGVNNINLLLKKNLLPDAIFSANDTAAVGAIQVLKSINLRIPEDIAIVGFNNDPISSIIEPSLTTIAQPAFEMGKLAAEQVFKQKGDANVVASETIKLKTRLIIRDSSLKSKEE